MVRGHRHEGRDAIDALLVQQRLVGLVAVDHHGLGEHLRGVAGQALVRLDHDGVHLQRLEATRQLEADRPRSGDHHPAPLLAWHADQGDDVVQVLPGDREVDQVADRDLLFAVGNDPRVVPMDRNREGRRVREQQVHVGDAHAHEVGAGLHPKACHQQLAVHERDDVYGAGNL